MYSVQLFLLNLFIVITADGAHQNDRQQEGEDLYNYIWDIFIQKIVFTKQCTCTMYIHARTACVYTVCVTPGVHYQECVTYTQ